MTKRTKKKPIEKESKKERKKRRGSLCDCREHICGNKERKKERERERKKKVGIEM